MEDNINKPIDLLDLNTKDWYKNLDEVESTKNAVSLGFDYGLSKSKVNRLLQNENLFSKVKHGEYQKVNCKDFYEEPIIFDFGNDELNEAVENLIQVKRELNKEMTNTQLSHLKNTIKNKRKTMYDEDIIERIDRAIQSGGVIYWEDRE